MLNVGDPSVSNAGQVLNGCDARTSPCPLRQCGEGQHGDKWMYGMHTIDVRSHVAHKKLQSESRETGSATSAVLQS